ncbi:hypothetical protein EV2_018883 [Malus domestica]
MQRTTTSHLKPLLRSPNPKPKTPTMSTPKSKPFNSSTSLLPLPPSLPPPHRARLERHQALPPCWRKHSQCQVDRLREDRNFLLLRPDLQNFFCNDDVNMMSYRLKRRDGPEWPDC